MKIKLDGALGSEQFIREVGHAVITVREPNTSSHGTRRSNGADPARAYYGNKPTDPEWASRSFEL